MTQHASAQSLSSGEQLPVNVAPHHPTGEAQLYDLNAYSEGRPHALALPSSLAIEQTAGSHLGTINSRVIGRVEVPALVEPAPNKLQKMAGVISSALGLIPLPPDDPAQVVEPLDWAEGMRKKRVSTETARRLSRS